MEQDRKPRDKPRLLQALILTKEESIYNKHHSSISGAGKTGQLMGFPYSSVGKESACNAGDLDLIPGSGRSLGEGNRNPLQCYCPENPMGRLQSMGSQE